MVEHEQLDLFELISECYSSIRKKIEEKWSEISDITISNSEWYIMMKIYKKQPTISSVTKNVRISRQATHKFIKKLESKGLVEILPGNNNRDKCIQLTNIGELCVEKYIVLKKDLEMKIQEKIGNEKYTIIKEILQSEWGN
ncbi:winged helix-turn-helix transcriptional regulator [Ureibacillus sp. Re31]|uniref:Winged helix-turn-helix transcriptional regulator n=1 Tax=Ureibacillus galli TaxID=2762222 RepID=A0ABR8XAF0_9BACL|nr:MarR family winged helix-turn-helix transcriptional regulator [Ureibacillus galli]MBD8026270.1 winged helix-turn-helix transcriptional regulator [Ureibacillus galli]